MNKILLCAAAFAAALLLPGAGTPAAAPKTAPDFPQQADLWINGGSPVKPIWAGNGSPIRSPGRSCASWTGCRKPENSPPSTSFRSPEPVNMTFSRP